MWNANSENTWLTELTRRRIAEILNNRKRHPNTKKQKANNGNIKATSFPKTLAAVAVARENVSVKWLWNFIHMIEYMPYLLLQLHSLLHCPFHQVTLWYVPLPVSYVFLLFFGIFRNFVTVQHSHKLTEIEKLIKTATNIIFWIHEFGIEVVACVIPHSRRSISFHQKKRRPIS